MTRLFDAELAGVHDPRGPADADCLRRALPTAVVVEAGSLAVAGPAPGWAGDVCAALAGRVQYPTALRKSLDLGSEAPIERALADAYGRWGVALLERVKGPFALALWNRHEQRGLLAQDQLGGRSLFTFVDGSRLLFATEVAVLLALLRRQPDPDPLALAYHLVDHSVPDGRMLFGGIRRIGGGCHLELSGSGHVERRHWAPRYQLPLRAPRAELAARLRDALAAAVGDAVAGEPSAAVLLSGGLDSSAITALAARRAPGLRAISAAFPIEPEFDETAWARQVADHLDISLIIAPIERRDPLGAAETYLRTWRLPLPVPGIIIEEPLITAARELGVDVVLDGQGGDELLGAAHFLIADRLRQGRPFTAWRLARRNPWLGSAPPWRHVWQVFTTVGVRGALPPGIHERIRRRRPAERYAPTWLSPGLMRLYRDTEDPWRWKRLDGPRWWAWLADALTRGRETADIADYVRRRGRVRGIQARSPLLDVTLVEFVLRLPPETNFDPVTSRPLVREALHDALPRDVLARRDKGDFAALHHRTLSEAESLGWIRRLLDERTAEVNAHVDLRQVQRRYLDRPPAVGDQGWRAWAVHVWNIVTAEMWLRAQAGRATEPLAKSAQRP
jgi:asparagine synthase (glutamine-hydrolysing)